MEPAKIHFRRIRIFQILCFKCVRFDPDSHLSCDCNQTVLYKLNGATLPSAKTKP